jgi:hypothetical protein
MTIEAKYNQKIQFRTDRKGRLILRVGHEVFPDVPPSAPRQYEFRDATIADIKKLEIDHD